jgi:histidinol-phosphate/aromatic aminotransferase/cobyric acid decarboxylase-like protein
LFLTYKKNFALAPLRIGYIIAPNQSAFEKFLKVLEHMTTTFWISVLLKVAVTTGLTDCNY